MKNKIIIIGIVLTVFVVVFVICFTVGNNNSGKRLKKDNNIENVDDTKSVEKTKKALENNIVELGRSFDIYLDEKVVVKDEDLYLELIHVDDSRCPMNVECYWEGEIEYQLIVNDNNYKLSTVNNREINYGKYLISLDKENNSIDYAKIIVEKKEGE